MTRFKLRLAGLALLAGATALPALAAGSASSASSAGSSASFGSLSTSIETSSDASSKGGDVAQGDYRIVELADSPARPGTVRVTLQVLAAQGAEGRLFLYVPQATATGAQLAVGERVNARERPYGLEFAYGEPLQAFFLVVHDEGARELRTRPVTL
ncbi:MAG: hypothetical protein IPJ42_15315 [Betaproteobacteria bacterium]|nr:hypothetical protein [Betaproteobacteria bacterium]